MGPVLPRARTRRGARGERAFYCPASGVFRAFSGMRAPRLLLQDRGEAVPTPLESPAVSITPCPTPLPSAMRDEEAVEAQRNLFCFQL